MTVTALNYIDSEITRITDEVREYVIHFEAITDSISDGPAIIRNSLPTLGSPYIFGNESDAFAFCVSHGPIRRKGDVRQGVRNWMAAAKYSTRPRENCTTQQTDSPLDKPPHIRTTGLRLQKPAPREDLNATKIVNSAERPFEGLSVDSSAIALMIQLNQATVDLNQLDAFTDSVNSGDFFGLARRKWKMEPPSVELMYYGQCDVYYTVIYEFHSSTDEWTLKPLDASDRDLFDNLPADAAGNAYAGIAPLDGAGFFNGKDDDPVYFDGGGALAPFEVYPEKNFADLGIPTGLP